MKMGKEILHLLHRDMVLGLFSIRYRWIAAMVVYILILVFSLYQLIVFSEVEGIDHSTLTYTDLLFAIFKGCDYQIINNTNLEFPFSWLIIQLIGPFIIGGYVRDDLFDHSSFLLVRTKHRFSLWMSKLLFSIAIVILTFIFFIMIAFIASIIFLSSSSVWSEYGESTITSLMSTNMTPFAFTIKMMLLPFLIAILTTILHAVLTVFIRPVYALLVILSLLVLSVYSTNRFLPGSYSMILRHQLLDPIRGFSWNVFIFYVLVIFIIAVTFGYLQFKKMDIFSKGKD